MNIYTEFLSQFYIFTAQLSLWFNDAQHRDSANISQAHRVKNNVSLFPEQFKYRLKCNLQNTQFLIENTTNEKSDAEAE